MILCTSGRVNHRGKVNLPAGVATKLLGDQRSRRQLLIVPISQLIRVFVSLTSNAVLCGMWQICLLRLEKDGCLILSYARRSRLLHERRTLVPIGCQLMMV